MALATLREADAPRGLSRALPGGDPPSLPPVFDAGTRLGCYRRASAVTPHFFVPDKRYEITGVQPFVGSAEEVES